ncbi:MAG: thiamine pyrophosphate-binding protein [Miltoncostaeaceae bacterium]
MAERDAPTIGEYLIDALGRRGVEHVFGVPGDYILRLFQIGSEAGVTMVNSTREEAAVYAADGYAREKGLGAVAVTYGVGTLATLAATGGANAERVPVLIIGGGPGLGERDGRHIHHMRHQRHGLAAADDLRGDRSSRGGGRPRDRVRSHRRRAGDVRIGASTGVCGAPPRPH